MLGPRILKDMFLKSEGVGPPGGHSLQILWFLSVQDRFSGRSGKGIWVCCWSCLFPSPAFWEAEQEPLPSCLHTSLMPTAQTIWLWWKSIQDPFISTLNPHSQLFSYGSPHRLGLLYWPLARKQRKRGRSWWWKLLEGQPSNSKRVG